MEGTPPEEQQQGLPGAAGGSRVAEDAAGARFGLLVSHARRWPQEEVLGALAAYFDGIHKGDVDTFRQVWHPEGHQYSVDPAGCLRDLDAEATYARLAARLPATADTSHDKVLEIDVHDECTAYVTIEIALPPGSNPQFETKAALCISHMVMLKDDRLGWRIISEVYTLKDLNEVHPQDKVTPEMVTSLAEAAWLRYVGGGRTCDRKKMASVFHPAARLTYAANGAVGFYNCTDFCDRVQSRWEVDVHRPFAHLRDDARIGHADTLVKVHLASPTCGVVILHIGYPPFLYKDILTFLRLAAVPEVGPAGWWIVAKSSCHVPFLTELALPA